MRREYIRCEPVPELLGIAFGDLCGQAPSFERVTVGGPGVRASLGGGLPLGTVTLVAGVPGCGKTTWLMQWAMETKGSLFGTSEQTYGALAELVERLGPAESDARVLETPTVEAFAEFCGSVPWVRLAILDSLSAVRVAGEARMGDAAQLVAAVMALKALARERPLAVVASVHVTKDDRMAGPRTVEHLVDAVAMLEPDKALPGVNWIMGKCRYAAPTERIVPIRRGTGGAFL